MESWKQRAVHEPRGPLGTEPRNVPGHLQDEAGSAGRAVRQAGVQSRAHEEGASQASTGRRDRAPGQPWAPGGVHGDLGCERATLSAQTRARSPGRRAGRHGAWSGPQVEAVPLSWRAGCIACSLAVCLSQSAAFSRHMKPAQHVLYTTGGCPTVWRPWATWEGPSWAAHPMHPH